MNEIPDEVFNAIQDNTRIDEILLPKEKQKIIDPKKNISALKPFIEYNNYFGDKNLLYINEKAFNKLEKQVTQALLLKYTISPNTTFLLENSNNKLVEITINPFKFSIEKSQRKNILKLMEFWGQKQPSTLPKNIHKFRFSSNSLNSKRKDVLLLLEFWNNARNYHFYTNKKLPCHLSLLKQYKNVCKDNMNLHLHKVQEGPPNIAQNKRVKSVSKYQTKMFKYNRAAQKKLLQGSSNWYYTKKSLHNYGTTILKKLKYKSPLWRRSLLKKVFKLQSKYMTRPGIWIKDHICCAREFNSVEDLIKKLSMIRFESLFSSIYFIIDDKDIKERTDLLEINKKVFEKFEKQIKVVKIIDKHAKTTDNSTMNLKSEKKIDIKEDTIIPEIKHFYRTAIFTNF